MTPPRRPVFLATTLTIAVLAGVAWAAEVQQPQPPVPTTPPVVAQANKPSVSTKEPIRPAQVRTAPPPRAEAKPTWVELTPHQQSALAPLSATWRTLGEAHKRKWLALSENFHSMPPPEQARLHSRMTEWAALSPQQRNAARLNFAEAQKVAPEDKRAKWEAYQALPAEKRRELAEKAANKQAARPCAQGAKCPTGTADLEAKPKSNLVPQPPRPAPAKAVAPSVVQAKPGATTVLITQATIPPAHQQAGQTKVWADPELVDSKTLLPKKPTRETSR